MHNKGWFVAYRAQMSQNDLDEFISKFGEANCIFGKNHEYKDQHTKIVRNKTNSLVLIQTCAANFQFLYRFFETDPELQKYKYSFSLCPDIDPMLLSRAKLCA